MNCSQSGHTLDYMAAPAPDATRWLDEDEMAFWLTFLEASYAVTGSVEAELKQDAGMGFDDYDVLVHLSEAEGRRLRMSELSEQSLHSRSRLTQRVDRLVERGLVRREKCPEDRRGTFAVLTDEGFARIRDAAPGHVEAVRVALIDRLTPEELRTGTEILRRLTRRPDHD